MNQFPMLINAEKARRYVGLVMGLAVFATPYVARLSATLSKGDTWFLDYVPSALAALLTVVCNLVPSSVVLMLGSRRGLGLPFWLASVSVILYSAIVHFQYLDLRSASTAGLGVLFVPVYAALLGLFVWWIATLFGRRAREP